jgi:hypothetical protein
MIMTNICDASVAGRASTSLRSWCGAACRSAAIPLLILCFLAAGGPSARADKRDALAPADLAAKDSSAFPGTDAEILISTHIIEETSPNVVMAKLQMGEEMLRTENFVRAKVYTSKGVADQGKFRIEFGDSHKVVGIEAMVVKPDGTRVELKKSDFFESVMSKTKREGKWKQITFVFPGLEPGDVIEYRWTEQIPGELWMQGYFCQELVPVREYRFQVGRVDGGGSVAWLHCPPAETSDRDGYLVTLHNIPAFEAEPHMPPEREVRGWIYVTKAFIMYPKDEDTWKELSRYWADEFGMATRPGSAIKKKAEGLAAGAAGDDEKLRRLYVFCQKEIFNTAFRTSAQWQAEIESHRDDKPNSPAKILELGRGRWDEINHLFASMARGLGYQVKLARNASRADMLNVKIGYGWAFLNRPSVAVKVGAQWRFFDPGNYFVPYGMMSWLDEGATALVCDLKKTELAETSVSPIAQTQSQSKGRFSLDAEGTLEGYVEQVFIGHLAISRKQDNWQLALEDVNKAFRDEITSRLPNAEVSDVAWTNLQSNEMPLKVTYRVRVPGYAEQAGKRLVLAPAFFRAGLSPVFTAAERKYPIMFSYPWSEHDDIEIVLPEGYVLDKPSAPAPVGQAGGAFAADYKLQYNAKARTFGYRRDYAVGANGACSFRTESYPVLKSLFEQLNKSDTHAILLKPKEAPAPAPVSQPASAQ